MSTNDPTLDVLFKLYLLSKKIKAHSKRKNKDQVLEFATLKLLDEKARPLSELAEILHVGLSSLSEGINKLKSKKLLENLPSKDARISLYTLSPLGKKRLKELKQNILNIKHEILEGLSPEELISLNKILNKLTSSKIRNSRLK